MPVEEVKLALQAVARLLHLSFDKFARRVVLPQAVKPSPAVEFDNGDPAVRAEIFPEVGEIAYAVIDVMIRVAGKDEVDPPGMAARDRPV